MIAGGENNTAVAYSIDKVDRCGDKEILYYSNVHVHFDGEERKMREYYEECECLGSADHPYTDWIESNNFYPGKEVTCYVSVHDDDIVYNEPDASEADTWVLIIIILGGIFCGPILACICATGAVIAFVLFVIAIIIVIVIVFVIAIVIVLAVLCTLLIPCIPCIVGILALLCVAVVVIIVGVLLGVLGGFSVAKIKENTVVKMLDSPHFPDKGDENDTDRPEAWELQDKHLSEGKCEDHYDL